MFDLSTLPAPNIIQQPDFEAVFDRQLQRFVTDWEARRVANPGLPQFTVQSLLSDPSSILIESESWRELVLLSRINDAARARLLAFATEGDLEHLAAFYDVARMPGESDSRLKERVILTIQGRSTGGPSERYKAIAMAADIRVQRVEIYRPTRSPRMHVAIYSTEPNGVASPSLLAAVEAALTKEDVRLVNDEFVFGSAVQKVANLAFDVWLLPDSDNGIVDRAIEALRNAWAVERILGRDLVLEWWTSKLMIQGIHKIAATNPITDIVAEPFEAVSLGTVTPNLRGRAF